MSALRSRVKKAEQALGDIAKGPPLILFAEPGETDEQVYSRNGVVPDPDRLDIMIVKFSQGAPNLPFQQQPKETALPLDLDSEIAEILADLQAQGLTEDQIETMLVEGGTKSTTQEYQAVEDVQKAEAQPIVNRADDVISLFRGRR